MKPRISLFIAAAAAVIFSSMLAKSQVTPPRHGTSILHFFVRKAMVNQGVITNAFGSVEANRNQQGHADNQRLNIAVGQLDAGTAYELLAALGDDTNFTQVAQFTTGTNGAAFLRYVRVGSSQNPNAGVGHGRAALPVVLNPISNLRQIAIANGSAQVVLVADLTVPDKLQYLIRRWLDNTPASANAQAQMRLKATTSVVQFKLRASGLEPGADYLLAVNGTPVCTNAADASGLLSLTNLPVSPTDILRVRTLAVWDAASNNILSTRLP